MHLLPLLPHAGVRILPVLNVPHIVNESLHHAFIVFRFNHTVPRPLQPSKLKQERTDRIVLFVPPLLPELLKGLGVVARVDVLPGMVGLVFCGPRDFFLMLF